MDEGIYFCKHCNGLIESFNEVGNHPCFRGKEYIYQDEEDNSILFVHNYDNENKENHEKQVFNNEESEVNNSLLSDVVWTKQATMAMLSLYEANIQMLMDIGKKSRVWKKISEGLKDLCIQVTADQVKWKFNCLNNKYKECIDNNNMSGRAHMTFEYYEQFEEIFHKENNVATSSTFSSSILTTGEKKRKHDITGYKNISKSKKLKAFNEAGNRQCFRGKEYIYQDEEDNSILFVHNYDNENKENHEKQVFNNEESEVNNSLLSDVVWTKQATMAMLSLYEANIQMLMDIGKKSRVWKKISEGLKDLCIQVTADQVKWKFNRLNNKYKECIDNNNMSGRAHMTFEYYEQFEEIFHKENNVATSSTFSSSILTTGEKKRKHDITGYKNISKSKKLKAFNEAGNRQCFRGKEYIYQDEEDNSILFVHNYDNENKENHEKQVFNNEESEVNNSLLSDDTAYIESDEDLSQSADFKTESNPKKNVVWTKQATMAMLSLYEANIQMLMDIGKKSRVWKKISEGLKDLCIQVTADQVKWKFNRLNNKYKECIDNNNMSGRAHMTFEYYEQFEEIFHKENNVATSSTFSSSILTTGEKKRKHDITGSKNISKSKKLKVDATSNEKNLPPVDESPKLKTTPIADVKKTARNQQHIQSMEILEKIQENQKARDEKMTKYLKIKEKEMDLKKKAIDVRETETQVKRDVASDKLKFNEKKHKDWLNIEKLKCDLLKKLLKNRTDSESD